MVVCFRFVHKQAALPVMHCMFGKLCQHTVWVEHQALLNSMSVRVKHFVKKSYVLTTNSSHISWFAGSKSHGISGLSGAPHLSILHHTTP